MDEGGGGALAPGDEVELEIDRLAAGGDGVGRLADGRVVFVPFTAPGDRVRAAVEAVRPRFARAELTELLRPGRGRTLARCPVFGVCGGCQWQHLDYATQCEAKRRIASDALERVGGLALPGPVELVPSPEPYAYRARARVAAAGGEVGFRRRKSHAICAIRGCPVLAPEVEVQLEALADSAPASGEWEISAAGAHRAGASAPPLELVAGPDRLRVSANVFFQGHAGLHAALLEGVAEAAGRGALAVELYAGAGFFTLGLARAFGRVVAVEAQADAVGDLRHNLARAGLANVEVRRGRVESALASRALAALRPDAVVLDPPRSGLPPGGPEAIAALAPQRIAYLSCDPATLARDLARLAQGGYRLERARVFDLFPQTPHVEVLACVGPRLPR